MSAATGHRHKVEFVRGGDRPTSAVCADCRETLIDDVHAWAEARFVDADDGDPLSFTLRQAVEQAVNRDG